MKFTYHPDLDSLHLSFTEPFGDTVVNITHLAYARLDADSRITGISVGKASWQFGVDDLNDAAPEVVWKVPEFDVDLSVLGATHNGSVTHRKLIFWYFPDTDTLAISFTDPPSDRVVDITDIDYADINSDGSLNLITIEQATKVLRIDDLATSVPEMTWAVYETELGQPAPVN